MNNQVGNGRKSQKKTAKRTPSKKQLAALARGRAIRMRNIKRNSKRNSKSQKGGGEHDNEPNRSQLVKTVSKPAATMTTAEIEDSKRRMEEMPASEMKTVLKRKPGMARNVTRAAASLTASQISDSRERMRKMASPKVANMTDQLGKIDLKNLPSVMESIPKVAEPAAPMTPDELEDSKRRMRELNLTGMPKLSIKKPAMPKLSIKKPAMPKLPIKKPAMPKKVTKAARPMTAEELKASRERMTKL